MANDREFERNEDRSRRTSDRDIAGDYRPTGPDEPGPRTSDGRDYGYEGGRGGGYSGARFPRMGRESWITQDLGYQGDYAERDFDGRADTYRYADSGFYPSDHPSYRGGYARTRFDDDQRRFRDRAGHDTAPWSGAEALDQGGVGVNHRGKGPRGYRRSDERITEDVHERLSEDPALDASDIEVSVSGGEVTLDGHVSSRWAKRRAEDCVESVSGIVHVQNNLRVRENGSDTSA